MLGTRVRANDLIIPPHGTAMLQGVHVLSQPARIHSVRGHMHLRGKYQMLEALYADGRREILSKVNWEHGWHTTFLYEDHVQPLLPKGTTLIVTSWFDNTANNPYNPDPDQWVVFGKRTADDMSHMWIGITYFDDEEAFERLGGREGAAGRSGRGRGGGGGVDHAEVSRRRTSSRWASLCKLDTPHCPGFRLEERSGAWPICGRLVNL